MYWHTNMESALEMRFLHRRTDQVDASKPETCTHKKAALSSRDDVLRIADFKQTLPLRQHWEPIASARQVLHW